MKWIISSFALVVAVTVTAAQQPPAAPPPAKEPFKNLKVLPLNITHDELGATMRGFTKSLGVRCNFCHVGEEGQPLSTYDFASDAKRNKKIARTMIVMTRSINRDYLSTVGRGKSEASCWTCHRGMKEPEEQPAAPAGRPGPEAKP